MSYQSITLVVDGGIATLTVNRPDKLNALNDAMMAELSSAIDEVRARDDIGGIDPDRRRPRVRCRRRHRRARERRRPSRPRHSPRAGSAFSDASRPVPSRLSPRSTASRSAAAASSRWHATSASLPSKAKFGQPEVKLGIVTGLWRDATAPAPRRKGSRASAPPDRRDDRRGRGIPHRPRKPRRAGGCADRNCDGAAQTDPRQRAARRRACIEAVDRGLDMSLEGGLALEATYFGLLSATSDMKEGMKAFLEKRAAEFKRK